MNAVCRMLGACNRCRRNFDRTPFIIGVVKSRRLTVGERKHVHGEPFWKAGALRTEIELDFDGRRPVVLYKFILN
jgi:hypothetical protein